LSDDREEPEGATRAIGRPSEAALWTSLATTLTRTVLPAIEDAHTRQVVIQLAGLAAYGRDRPADPTAARVDDLAAVLDALAEEGNHVVVPHWSAGGVHEPAAVLRACAEVLAAAVAADGVDGEQARERLRPLLVRHLDEDLATEAVLMAAFRGTPPDG
jgi:hypothetical protein